MALKYISSTISETDGHVFYDNHDLDRVIWVDPQEGSHVVWERQQPSEWKGLRILPTGDNMVSVKLVVTEDAEYPLDPINPIYYSGDQGVTWNELTTTDSAEYSEIWLKAYNPTGYHAIPSPNAETLNLKSWYSIACTGESYATGYITSLLDSVGNLNTLEGCDDYAFAGFFRDRQGLTNDLIGYDCFNPTTLSKGCYRMCLPRTTVYCSALPAMELAEQCYSGMFRDSAIESMPYLNATTLYQLCYYAMFCGCQSLTQLTPLPATNLAVECYSYMFYASQYITEIPSGFLPATTMYSHCYYRMFYACTRLTTIPSNLLPATNLAGNCYHGMFEECSALVEVPSNLLPATNLAAHCYYEMFYGCGSLTSAPSLPATNLANSCYSRMFLACRSLTNPPALPATTLAASCYFSMFNGCTSLVNAPALPATTLADSCYSYMFNDCTALQVAPILPAERLESYCYSYMFNKCSSLNTIICLATDRNEPYVEPQFYFNTYNWCYGVPEVGDFYCPSEVTPQWVEWDEHNIPPYWTRHSTDKVIIYGYSEHGTVEGSGTYNIGDSVTLTFTPSQGYVFDHWEYIDGTTASTDNPYTFVASESLVLKAVTEYARYTIDAGALNGVVAATVGGSPVQLPYTGAYGTVVELTVSPTQGHDFWFWVDGSTDNPRRVTLTEDMELYAVCVATDMQYLYFLPGEVGDVGNKSPYSIRFIWSGTQTAIPNIEYSTYETETQSWSEWTECTWEERQFPQDPGVYYYSFAPIPGGRLDTIKPTRLRGYNPDGFNGKLNISTSGYRFITDDTQKPIMLGHLTALLYGGVEVTTLIQPYCFAHLFRMKAGVSGTQGFAQPRIVVSNNGFLSPTILSPHCYEGMFAIDAIDSSSGYGYQYVRAARLPATNLAEGCYKDINAFNVTDYRRYAFDTQVFYYGPSLTESQMTYYCGEWFKGSRAGWLHVKQDVTVPEIGHGITILHDLA